MRGFNVRIFKQSVTIIILGTILFASIAWAVTYVNGVHELGPPAALNESNYISAYLTNAGSNDMGVDGSTTPTTFSYTPPSGQCIFAGRIMMYLAATSNFTSTKFANQNALANGISIRVNGEEIENWKDNIDIATTMYDVIPGDALGTGKAILGRWSFYKASKMAENGLRVLPGAGGLSIVIQDDLSAAGLVLRVKVQGVLK